MTEMFKMDNKNNQWHNFLDTSKNVPNAIEPKKTIDIQEQLRAKYPSTPFPRGIVRTFSDKQRKAIGQKV